MNKTLVTGRLTSDPYISKTRNDDPVASFTIAVDRDFRNSRGEKDTDFIHVSTYGNAAEFVEKYIVKDKLVLVDGFLKTKTSKGEFFAEIIAEKIEDLEKPYKGNIKDYDRD